ncbi:TNFAIP3-interacting protein 3 isoform X2 [Tympanuchus pallidicinctus]|uniref:TNFAIP3-interacting protein 3 isoform X2 n=1 Tax=Tympanuchus pallidicinctus TaxID=109042 RepID=UPI0022871CAB|nr:TNFAIP3-interacting protein 3 isoform X2 [Tympanuchus pallidicinctus]
MSTLPKMIHCEKFKRKNKEAENLLELCSHQHVEMERCESKELDVEIRNLIERSGVSKSCEDSEPIAQGSLNHQRTSCSPKICCETNAQGHLGSTWADMSEMEAPADLPESKQGLPNKQKTLLANSQERHILSLERQRQELLEVNKQWDHQFRTMKQLYEKQLAEVKAKLHVSEKRVSELEEERHRHPPEKERLQILDRDTPSQEMKETKVLSEALHEMKEENKLLKQKNASMIRKQEHYECEISRLNKALLDVLEKNSSVLRTPSETGDKNSFGDMRTQLEVLRQQVQIYEEDFRKERSDRERLNEEKEALQKANERLQTQLNKLNSQMKTCLKGKEPQERQLQQQTKDIPLQSERLTYPPPLFLSPCVNYGSCGLLLHYQDPRVHRVSRRAQEQQQHSTISGMFLTSFLQMFSTRQRGKHQISFGRTISPYFQSSCGSQHFDTLKEQAPKAEHLTIKASLLLSNDPRELQLCITRLQKGLLCLLALLICCQVMALGHLFLP